MPFPISLSPRPLYFLLRYELQLPERGPFPWKVEPAVPIVADEVEIGGGSAKKNGGIIGRQTAAEVIGFVKHALTSPLVAASRLARVSLKQGSRAGERRARIRLKIKMEVNGSADVLSHTVRVPRSKRLFSAE